MRPSPVHSAAPAVRPKGLVTLQGEQEVFVQVIGLEGLELNRMSQRWRQTVRCCSAGAAVGHVGRKSYEALQKAQ